MLEGTEMAESESRLTEEAGYNDDSTAKPIPRKKKNTRKRRHGELTESRYSSDIIELKIILAC